ncbi:MAG TPA: hypothetical protein VMN60_00500 [Longimicrobiales bacterium]|nr:hypothetical protein [Longimicrobiales bacterium]
MKRTIRRTVDAALPVAGIALVLGAVLFLWRDLMLQIGVVILGIFLIEAGIWKLAHPLLPSQRKHRALRAEVDDFIGLVRRLNTAAIEHENGNLDAAARVDSSHRDMLASVARMAELAGKESDPAVGPPVRIVPERI